MKRTANVKKMTELILPTEAEIEEIENQAKVKSSESAVISPEVSIENSDDIDVVAVKISDPKYVKPLPIQDNYEIVFRMKDIIVSFAANPLDMSNIAVATHDKIVEVDADSAMSFFEVFAQ
jgi:hypothetical protein